MQIYSRLTDLRAAYPRLVIALGMFDGVHIGHQSIIRRAVELAHEQGGRAMVFTFSNHPLSVLSPRDLPPQIGSSLLRSRLIAELGVDILMAVPFTKQLAQRSPEAFLAMLRDYFAPRCVVTGPNYTFGSRGKGTHRMLLREAEAYGFEAEVCPAVLLGGRTVSSTRIRALLQQGRLDEARACLGRPFTVLDRVIHGERRGRTLGFPTANLAITDAQVMLPNGVYATRVLYGDGEYLGLANIGDNPTFEGCNRRLEVHLEDFSGDLYDRLLEVQFLAKIREEEKFASVDQLVRKMHDDRRQAQKIWQRR
ncbi:riboflavin biosynthesis protein RibF [uncultured Mitsuokella sp.]|uniref:riboflavin biosynthesis protein RibF n=1 Tax=uncultured Mitsuokella sp. TaxID=453120 RepID=UPI0026DD161D|nr:riboflavin biosynthesis protein RibF [uncultured Mitsuokella sp.]